MLSREQKQATVTELKDTLNGAVSTVLVDTLGTKSNEFVAFRKHMRSGDVGVKTINNKLIKRIINETQFAALEPIIVGPSTLLWSDSEPGKPAKLLEALLQEYENVKVKGICLGGELIAPERLKDIAKLPSKQEALSQLAGILQAPITKFAATLNQVPTSLVLVLTSIKNQKDSS